MAIASRLGRPSQQRHGATQTDTERQGCAAPPPALHQNDASPVPAQTSADPGSLLHLDPHRHVQGLTERTRPIGPAESLGGNPTGIAAAPAAKTA